MAQFSILVLPGDGIGPEVTTEAVKVLQAVGQRFEHTFTLSEDIVGGAAIDQFGSAIRDETLETAKQSAAVLFGAVGGPKWDDPKAPMSRRPEWGLLRLRKELGLFANLRPVRVNPLMVDGSTIKQEVLRGVDMVVIRELTGGLYFGQPQKRWSEGGQRHAVDTLSYSEEEITRILRVGFELARSRRKKLTSVDKANILDTSRLWREIATELAPQYPDVQLDHMLVDSAAMFLVRRPADFDVIVTENTFGDILTDEASMLAGSMGMLPSASLGERRPDGAGLGMYEPIHGTAPDIAGQGKANPLAAILSMAMLLRLSLGLAQEADAVERAVDETLAAGFRTVDVNAEGARLLSTTAMGDEVAGRV